LLALAWIAALSGCDSGCDVQNLSPHDIGRQQCDTLLDVEARKALMAKLAPADDAAYERQREKLSVGARPACGGET
jgi:hypothetical protein